MASSRSAATSSKSRSAGAASRRSRPSRLASATSVVDHSRAWTTLAMAWSAVASPVGRYGAAENVSISVRSAVFSASCSSSVAWPRTIARRYRLRVVAHAAALARSRSPGLLGDSSSTAAVPTTEASHQPASRGPIVLAPPADATGST